MGMDALFREGVPRWHVPGGVLGLSQALDSVPERDLRSRFAGIRYIFG
jgi:hypothetical protein